MAATQPQATTSRRFFRVRYLLIAVVLGAYAWTATREHPFFNDTNYANLSRDMDKTLAYENGSPEQTAAYMMLGKHLNTPMYFGTTGIDVCRWFRDPENPLRPLLKQHRQLKNDWETKGDDGLSNADHYNGFVAGPVSAARTLFMESTPELLDALNALLWKLAGTDPDTLDLAAQEALVWKAIVETPEGREMNATLTGRRLLWDQTEGYTKMKNAVALPGLALRWMQHNFLILLVGVVLVRRGVKVIRGERSANAETAVPAPRFEKLERGGLLRRAVRLVFPTPASVPAPKNATGLPVSLEESKCGVDLQESMNGIKLDQSHCGPVRKQVKTKNDKLHNTSPGRPIEVVVSVR